MTVYVTNDFTNMLDDNGGVIARLDASAILESVGEAEQEPPAAVKGKIPDAVKVKDRVDALAVGWVSRAKLKESDQAPVIPVVDVPRFIEACQDAAIIVRA